MNGVGGLPGWQWLFLVEGLPAVVLGFIALRYLTDRPDQAHWLAVHERTWLTERMGREEKHREQRHGFTLQQTLANWRVWLLCLLYFTVSLGANTYGLYLPTILKIHFKDAKEFEIGLLSAVPAVAAIIAMVLIGAHSDRTGERRWHVAVPAFVGATGWLVVALANSPGLALAGLALSQLGMMSMLAPFWSLPTSFLSGTAAAGGIAFINSVGNLGGFVGPNLIGMLENEWDSFTPGLLCLAGVLAFGGILAIFARHDPGAEKESSPGNNL
jgi:ACS family tartrate transporter-like MFS transporter